MYMGKEGVPIAIGMILNRFKTETINGSDYNLHDHQRSCADTGHNTG